MVLARSTRLLVGIGLLALGRYAQTTHNCKKPLGSVTITNPIHPLHGQSVVVRSWRQVGNLVKVIVEHPDGGLLSIPASETSLEVTEPVPQIAGQTPKFNPKKLLMLARWSATLDPAATVEISSGQQHQEVVQKNFDDTATQSPQSLAKRTRRAHPAVDQSDSTFGGQNARPTNTQRQAAKEDF